MAEPGKANVVIVNTCGFIRPARQESLGELRSLARRRRPGQRIVAAGCLAELNPAMLKAEVPGLDALLSTRRWSELPGLLARLTGYGAATSGAVNASTPRRTPPGATAYVKIAEGCDGPCAFCTIPTIKGPYVSRPAAEIVDEVADLVARGYKEVILIAQDTTHYGRDRGERDGLPALVEAILAAAPSLPWLRLMYAYPQHVSDRLLTLMAQAPQICHYLDLPLQHAHPDVLRRMRRPADIAGVVAVLHRARSLMPDLAIRTAFITGYPGETRQEFEALRHFVREQRIDHVGVFSYSREAGTAAHDLQPQIAASVKERRRCRLLEEQQSVSLAINRSLVGREFDVLIEGCGDGVSVGRTFRDAPEVDGLAIMAGQQPVGQFVRGRVVQGMEYDLAMEPL